MKKLIGSAVVFLIFQLPATAQNISINNSGTPPDPSAVLDISSNNKGLLIPRMTKNQRKTISTPKNGLMVYDSSTSSFWFYRKNQWQEMSFADNSLDSTLIYGQQTGTLASYNGDPTGTLVIAQDSSGYFYDSGGPGGNYGNNENYFFAIYSLANFIGYKVQVISNNLENPYDTLIIRSSGDYVMADTLTGTETGSYTFPNNPVVITFKSNPFNTAPGFVIRWDAIIAPASSGSNTPALAAGWHYNAEKLAMQGGFNFNNYWHKDSSGIFSLNYGYGNKAKGKYSLALGSYTSALENNSSAFGYGTVASGQSSSAFGNADTASGHSSTAFGYQTRSSGWASTSAGYGSIASNDYAFASGDHSIASGFNSTAFGREAVASGSSSIALGSFLSATATYSTAIGGVQNYATAPYSTVIGGVGCTASGDYSIALGNRISTNSKYGSVAIGDLNFSSGLGNDADNQMLMRFGGGYKFHLNDATLGMAINNLGFVGIGTSAPDEKLQVIGNIKCVSLIQTSDSRLKKNILPLRNSLQKIIRLNGYTYHWKDESLDKDLQTGILAQEVQKIFPQLVKKDKDGMLSVNYTGLIPVMIESIKEQQKQIDELKLLVDKLINNSPAAVK